MHAIHNHAELNPTCDLGSQNYEQWVVQKERSGEWYYFNAQLKDENTLVQFPPLEHKHTWLVVTTCLNLF